jgi:hypothetical protein
MDKVKPPLVHLQLLYMRPITRCMRSQYTYTSTCGVNLKTNNCLSMHAIWTRPFINSLKKRRARELQFGPFTLRWRPGIRHALEFCFHSTSVMYVYFQNVCWYEVTSRTTNELLHMALWNL